MNAIWIIALVLIAVLVIFMVLLFQLGRASEPYDVWANQRRKANCQKRNRVEQLKRKEKQGVDNGE